jgi:hypothetical protein
MAKSRAVGGAGYSNRGVPVDPTQNVKDLSEAANARQDDLRNLTKELYDAKIACIKEMGDLRERHQRELDHAESERLDSIRQVDREDVNKTAAQALSAIQTLAATTNTTAETLRTQVATTAQATANTLTTITGEINKRLSALELTSSEGKGKQTVADPQMEKLTALVEMLARNQATGTGKSEGISMVGALIMGGVALIGGLLGIAGVLYAVLKP